MGREWIVHMSQGKVWKEKKLPRTSLDQQLLESKSHSLTEKTDKHRYISTQCEKPRTWKTHTL